VRTKKLVEKFLAHNYYDAEVVRDLFKNHHFWGRFNWYYRSNWRVLHIDGMEGYVFSPKLPVSQGKQIQLFSYDSYSEKACHQ
jgi:hypothetical protein